MKDINAIPISPVIINVIPNPFKGSGTLEYFNFSLMAAIATIANNHPIPEEKPNTVASAILYSYVTINKEEPSMAQLTAIKGRNIPNEPYNEGEIFSITISTN